MEFTIFRIFILNTCQWLMVSTSVFDSCDRRKSFPGKAKFIYSPFRSD